MMRIFQGIIIFLLAMGGTRLSAQERLTPEDILSRADSLHRCYRFEEALELYQSAVGKGDAAFDETLRQRIAASQNGLNMTEFCATPHVVARQRFSREDFFLYYPLKPHSWHASPNSLDSLSGYPLYFPKEADVIYFSAPDRSGSRSLFITEDLDSLWRAPRLAGESLLSTGSEIYPMLSADGKTLYFASDGLYGVGGFDLYASSWDEENARWGTPVNMGFPFNSPADDFLLADSEDAKYTLFASNRACSADSVYVYVLERTSGTERRAVRGFEDLLAIAALDPEKNPARIDNESAIRSGSETGNANTRLYARKMEEARVLRDSIYQNERELDALRSRVAQADKAELAQLSIRIMNKENALRPMRQLLEETNLEIRLVEQTFLESGAVSMSEDREIVGAGLSYTFAKNLMGSRLKLKVASHPDERTFRIMPVGRFSPDQTLPEGIVYQIECFTSARHATLEDLHGLSPVYERLGANLRYSYSVGLYTRYVGALLDLNVIRKLGFPRARITAYRDGRPISVYLARNEE